MDTFADRETDTPSWSSIVDSSAHGYSPSYASSLVEETARYHEASELIHAPIVPVGDAWEIAHGRKPDLELWNKDGKHPAPAGTYLAACVFYKALFKQSPVGLKYTGSLDPATAALLQHAADDAGAAPAAGASTRVGERAPAS